MATEDLCTKLDKLLGEYYASFNKPYFDDDGVGKFAQWVEDNGFDDDTLVEELNGDANDTELSEFDDNFPLNTPIDDESKRKEEVISILKYCVEKGVPPSAKVVIDPSELKLEQKYITKQVIDESCKRYRQQTPKIYEAVHKEDDVLYFLAAQTANNDVPFLSNMVDCFARDKLKTQADKKQNNLLYAKDWIPHTGFAKKLLLRNSKSEIPDKVAKGITGYCKRICPLFQSQPLSMIDDSITDISNYILYTSQFIEGILKQKGVVPFQVDLCIAIKNITSASKIEEVGSGDDDDDEDADDHKVMDPSQVVHKIGDVEAKLKAENCVFIKTEAQFPIEQKRAITSLYKDFRSKLSEKQITAKKDDETYFHKQFDDKTYPKQKRFGIFVDRRKIKDKVIMFEPPYVCDSIYDNHVPECYFELIRKCIIPRQGYGDGMNDEEECKDAPPHNKTINSQTAVNGKILSFSFHVEAQDQIKCYLYWNGQTTRVHADDILKALKFIFDPSKFKSGKKEAKEIVKKINIKDAAFEAFYKYLDTKFE